jgi:hypothetical protein
LPISDIDVAHESLCQSGAVTAILKGQESSAGTSNKIQLVLQIIEISDNTTHDAQLFQTDHTIKIKRTQSPGESLRAGLQLVWTRYLSPYLVNELMSAADAKKGH